MTLIRTSLETVSAIFFLIAAGFQVSAANNYSNAANTYEKLEKYAFADMYQSLAQSATSEATVFFIIATLFFVVVAVEVIVKLIRNKRG